MRFLTEDDYSVLLRNEIKSALLNNYTDSKLHRAEDMAISQITNYLCGRYNVDIIFLNENITTDTRNANLVMITIDCAIYHLYTSTAPNLIPKHRAERYQDALNWLKDVAKGTIKANLPTIEDSNGNVLYPIKISSRQQSQNHKW